MPITQVLEQINFHQSLEASRGKAVALFSSPECASCRRWEELLLEYQEGEPELSLFKVNVIQDPGLAEEFNIFHMPALFLYNDGNYHCAIECPADLNELNAAIEAGLAAEPQEQP